MNSPNSSHTLQVTVFSWVLVTHIIDEVFFLDACAVGGWQDSSEVRSSCPGGSSLFPVVRLCVVGARKVPDWSGGR